MQRIVEKLQAGDGATAQFVGLPSALFHGQPLGPVDDFMKAIVKPLVERAALTQSFNNAWLIAGGIYATTRLLLFVFAPRNAPARRS